MPSDHPVMLLYPDLSGLSRGRSIPSSELVSRMDTGVGWVPADQAITPLGPIAEPNPWGPIGDLRLIPDAATEVHLDLWDGIGPLHFLLCDAVNIDGSPWDSCVRELSKRAIAALEQLGYRALVSFEQEFFLTGGTEAAAPGFSMEAFRAAEPFPSVLMHALSSAGLEPETLLPEYGAHQFEVSVRPTDPLTAADRAVAVREVTREVARRLGRRATFAPILDAEDVGAGVHVHVSLQDLHGKRVTFDPARPGGLSVLGGSFVAGILDHISALCALTAPSAVSYARLTPHRWSASYGVLGEQNREAAVRIAPTVTVGGKPAEETYNLEYRPADAAASPHVTLAALLFAGCSGLRARSPTPFLVHGDPHDLDEAQLAAIGAARLPDSLSSALLALKADEMVRSWFSDDLWSAYFSMKRTELELLDGAPFEECCLRYRDVY
jgi:glutamine synthetase